MHFPTAENGNHYGSTKDEMTEMLTKRMGGWGRVRERRIIQLVGCLNILFRTMRLDEVESAKQQVIISKLPRYYVNLSSRVPDLPLFNGNPFPKLECMTANPLISVPTNAKERKKKD
ncbi:hypothetical protein GE21DRAFT_1009899 [Neurospora crassa]|nr:hypothetical protein GE21DRAFT_1009899 [Neurospora crassa]